MAGDWIKMRTDLYRDPKVCVIADCLLDPNGALGQYVSQHCQRDMTVTRNVTRNAVVGALLSVWGVMRHRGKRNGDDLLCNGVTLSVLDDIADMVGFGEAMAAAKWARETEEGIVFPRFFEEYNSDPGPAQKSSGAERQRRYRERKRDASQGVTETVTRDVTVTPRVEKSREEEHRPQQTLLDACKEAVSPKPKLPPKRPLPVGWKPKPETVSALSREFGWRNGEAERYLAAFSDACNAKGYRYSDFDAAFRNCVRQDWPKFRSGRRPPDAPGLERPVQ